jgi:NCAIR mutase (PurE)-related protein
MRKAGEKGAKGVEFARLDFARKERTGFGETVFGPGKTPAQMATIFAEFARRHMPVLATRVTPGQAAAVRAAGVKAEYQETGRLLVAKGGAGPKRTARIPGRVAVLTGGTADIPVAEECAGTLEFFGAKAVRLFDVGVAGLHRLLGVLDKVRKADVVVAVAGMEGALPSVVSGLVSAPVVAVPTSVGYGAGAGGVAAALAMLNSCAEGVSVVNIDNGFGAAVVACRILRRRGRR